MVVDQEIILNNYLGQFWTYKHLVFHRIMNP
jgi:hypothetical protein